MAGLRYDHRSKTITRTSPGRRQPGFRVLSWKFPIQQICLSAPGRYLSVNSPPWRNRDLRPEPCEHTSRRRISSVPLIWPDESIKYRHAERSTAARIQVEERFSRCAQSKRRRPFYPAAQGRIQTCHKQRSVRQDVSRILDFPGHSATAKKGRHTESANPGSLHCLLDSMSRVYILCMRSAAEISATEHPLRKQGARQVLDCANEANSICLIEDVCAVQRVDCSCIVRCTTESARMRYACTTRKQNPGEDEPEP
jgi:hypothetical protein